MQDPATPPAEPDPEPDFRSMAYIMGSTPPALPPVTAQGQQ